MNFVRILRYQVQTPHTVSIARDKNLLRKEHIQQFQSRWHRPQDVLYMEVHIYIYINHLLGVCAIYSQSTIQGPSSP